MAILFWALAEQVGVGIPAAARKKPGPNRAKYPVEEARGPRRMATWAHDSPRKTAPLPRL